MEADGCPLTSRNGRVLCNVLDCGGAVTLENDSGTFSDSVTTSPFSATQRLRGVLRREVGWGRSRHRQ